MSGILVVDDESEIRTILQEILQDENYRVMTAANATLARELYKREHPQLVLLDIWMPDLDGISLLKEWMREPHPAPVIMMSGHGTVETAVEAVRLGAQDFIEKPLSTGKLLLTIERALQNEALRQENARLRARSRATTMLGKNPAIGDLRAQIEQLAKHDTPVLFAGELGAGKAVAARYLHAQSARAQAPLIEVNVAALADEEAIAVLFEGSAAEPSALQAARDGTLLLKEIGELPVSAQSRLFQQLANPDNDVRVLSTTSSDLRSPATRLRDALYYKIGAVSLHVPALRDHRDDVPELAHHFVDIIVEQEGLAYRRLSIAALNALRNYGWPGNVRELKNLVRRLLIVNREADIELAEVEEVLKAHVSAAATEIPEALFALPLRAARDRFEKAYLEYHLRRTGGNVGEVAQFVEMERTHLYRKLKGLGVNPKGGKED